MIKNNQKTLLASGLLMVGLIFLMIRKKDAQSNKEKQIRPKSSYSDLLKTSAPILVPFAKIAAEKLAQKIL